MSDEAEKRELVVRGPHRREGGDQHGIGVVLVMTRNDAWIGEACRHIERKPLPRAGGKFRRSKEAIGVRCAAHLLANLSTSWAFRDLRIPI